MKMLFFLGLIFIHQVSAFEIDFKVNECIEKMVTTDGIQKANLPLITYQLGKDQFEIMNLKDERYHLAKDKLEETTQEFLRNFTYRKLKWPRDMEMRDTGDWSLAGFNGHNYNGTHPAVVVYYSPEAYCWVKNDRKGVIPDGAVIIKEMYPPPAGKYQGIALNDLYTPWWTVMIKDQRGSFDGWFWLSVFDSVSDVDNKNKDSKRTFKQKLSSQEPDIYPEAGFGAYCIRCHSSAESQSTFLSLANVDGPYLQFKDDLSWKSTKPTEEKTNHPGTNHFMRLVELKMKAMKEKKKVVKQLQFLEIFNKVNIGEPNQYKMLPESIGRAWSHGDERSQWVTSDQCMGCHSGDNTPYGPNMFLKKGFMGDAGIDLSPWGEWRFSMMGLGGRDPIFHAQLESEMSYSKGQSPWTPEKIQDTCLKCHSAMGQRQFHLDKENEGKLFSQAHVFSKTKYGGLSRDGISCTVCHQMEDNSHEKLLNIATGNFKTIPVKNGKNTIQGPYDDVKTWPMEHSLGMTPRGSDFMKKGRVCASCHTVHLPVINEKGEALTEGSTIIAGGTFEQATYPEWVNSKYYPLNTCQTCHMPDHYGDEENKMIGKIANIQDADFPKGQAIHDDKTDKFAAHYMTNDENIKINKKPYRRHALQGINLFALEIFNQYSDILGLNQASYMTYNKNGLKHAILEGNKMAKEKTAKLEILEKNYADGILSLKIKVTNLAGHKFPSGVGFRRAFLEVKADSWCSGCTNSIGVILGENKKPLPSEFNENGQYQKHHQIITSANEAQIYEELVKDEKGNFTTSFLRIHEHVKDNRLLPIGWEKGGPSNKEGISKEQFLHATNPGHEAIKDADFTDGSGSDTIEYKISLKDKPKKVEATLYYQAIPPRFLNDRFKAAPEGPHTQRLYYMVTHLQTAGTPIENWKLKVTGDSAIIK